jgi:transcriptional regulator with GAF, ATPase, and Fis domain
VWEVRVADQAAALKWSTRDRCEDLASEAERLLFAGSDLTQRVLGAGRLSAELTLGARRAALGTPYILLSYVPGESLEQRLRSSLSAPDSLLLATQVARDIGRALSDLHASGVAHNDVKPANIVIAEPAGAAAQRCTLIDLGLATASHDTRVHGGTPRYLGVDLLLETAAPARDVWALGLSLLEILSPSARSEEPTAARLDPLLRTLPAPWPALLGVMLGPVSSRPSADFVCSTFEGADDAPSSEELAARQTATLKRTYLAQRRSALMRVGRGRQPSCKVTGLPGEWLGSTCEILEDIARLRGATSELKEHFEPLGARDRERWLLKLLGVASIDFPRLDFEDEAELVHRVLSLAPRPIESLTYADLAAKAPAHLVEVPPSSAEDLALCLGDESPSEALLGAVERLVVAGLATWRMTLRLSEAFRKRHQLGRALFALKHYAQAHAPLEPSVLRALGVQEAAIWLRAGDLERCVETLSGLPLGAEYSAAAAALLSRVALARGDYTQAESTLRDAETCVATLHAQASLDLTLGRLDAAEHVLETAAAWLSSADERARSEAFLANLAHQRGDAVKAYQHFRQASEQAARSGSLLEEATYWVGVAANASHLGKIADALAAARRSALLYEHLDNPGAVARARLAAAGAYAMVGAKIMAQQTALEARAFAKEVRDTRCQAFAHLVLSDTCDPLDAVEHLQQARHLLTQAQPSESLRPDDELRLASRSLRLGQASDLGTEGFLRLDELANAQPSVDARLEWWGARAESLLGASPALRVQDSAGVIRAVLAQLNLSASVEARGFACAFAAQLAAETGNGEQARQLSIVASEAFRSLKAGTPDALTASLDFLPWARLIRSPAEAQLSTDQLSDIETLLHGLAERGQLKALLNSALDALVLWTGVERGLLLLTAPGGQLVPRAARNIARADLSGQQLKLSTSLAERALATRECVIAVDAMGEIPDLHESVQALSLRSVLAVPLLARGDVLGVAYLDDRMRRGAFGARELSWVRLVAALAAVAIADARDQSHLRRAVRRARRAEARLQRSLEQRDAQLEAATQALAHRNARGTRFNYAEIVGNSVPILSMLGLVDRLAMSDIPVLISGESGSGKELVARAIHINSARAERSFITENCSAIPETLLESTLFGHVKGAFTGASAQRAGLFEIAHQGTFFLDEIADMSLGMQAKLLRVLESGEIRRVGGERTVKVNVRVLAATHKDLEKLVSDRAFREDLYYRLNVISVRVPSVRERLEDVPLLVRHFLEKHAPGKSPGKRAPLAAVSDAAMDALCHYHWPGNVRQLENEIRRALVLADGTIKSSDLSPNLRGLSTQLPTGLNLRQRVDALESDLIRKALLETNGNQSRAAQLLGLSRFGLQKMLKRLEITVETASGQSARPRLTDD